MGVVFVIVWVLCLLLYGVVFVIVWGLCLLLYGVCICYCVGLCLLWCVGCVSYCVGVVFVMVCGLCLLLSFLFGSSNLITCFGMNLVRFEGGASLGFDCANLRSVH